MLTRKPQPLEGCSLLDCPGGDQGYISRLASVRDVVRTVSHLMLVQQEPQGDHMSHSPAGTGERWKQAGAETRRMLCLCSGPGEEHLQSFAIIRRVC